MWMCVEESEEKEKYEDNEQVNEWMKKKKKKRRFVEDMHSGKKIMWKTCTKAIKF